MSEMFNVNTYRQRFGLFRSSDLNDPRIHPISEYQLPKRSLLHYVANDGVSLGPQSSDILLRSIPGTVYIDHVIKLREVIGKPTPKEGANALHLMDEYIRKNRSVRRLKNLDRLETDDHSLVVYNYSLLSHLIKYATNFRSGYYQWYNIYKVLFDNVNTLAKTSDRHQFIEIDLPDIVPGLTLLREFKHEVGVNVLKQLRSDADFIAAHLFLWAGDNRQASIFSGIERKHYPKVNLIFRRLDGWVSVNLAWLDSFRKNKADEKPHGLEPKHFELKVLKFITVLHQATSPIETETSRAVVVDEPEDSTPSVVNQLDRQDDEFLLQSDELLDHESEILKLEKELEELDKIKEEASANYETVDEEGNILETDPIVKADVTAQIGEIPAEGEAIVKKAEDLAGQGLLSGAEYNRLLRVSKVFDTLSDPYGSGSSIKDAMTITEEDLVIEPKPLTRDKVVTDASLAFSRVDVMDQQYISKVIRKDIMRCIASIQRAPIAITDWRVERETDAVNDRETHVLKIVPAVGAPSTIRIEVPIVKEDGSFLYSNTHYRMRKQRSDVPIRKISPTRVAISSYYAKVFAERTARTRFNYPKWFLGQLILKALDTENADVTKAVLSTVVDYKAPVPLLYSTIATRISSFNAGKFEFYFDYRHRIEKFSYAEAELKHEKNGMVLVGRGPSGPLLMDDNAFIYSITPSGVEDVGQLEELIGIDMERAPTSMVEIKVYSKNIPVGVSLAYLLGLDNLLKILKAKVRRVIAGDRLNLQKHEYVIRFKNESLVLDRNDQLTTLVMSGFNLFHNYIRNYGTTLFNDKDVYAAVLEKAGIGNRYLRELDSMNTLFIDPITMDLLQWMGEPTTFTGLLLRATEMLLTERVHSRRKDQKKLVEGLERVRGYERIPGTVYETLSRAVRTYTARASSGRASVTVNPKEAMTAIIQDPTTSPVNNINPIHSLREREVITFGGRGGRSRRAMVASARLFTEEDMGFVSEGTVDSGDVAIITYLSPNSNITSVRGTIRMFDAKRDGASSIMSTAALLSPSADCDDPKRVNFITVQHGHGIQAVGYETQPIRTGVERVVASRMTPEFASAAKRSGKVIEKSEMHVAIEYKDGTVERLPVGLVQTTAEGSMYPNTLMCDLEVGDSVEQDDVITYNRGFFKPSPLDKRRIDYMAGCMGRIALREATYTVEDSSSISSTFAERMGTVITKPKTILVDFNQEISDLVKVGDKVDLDSILCTIRDAVSEDAGLYDEVTRATLENWSAMAPKAKVVGTVSHIEMFYNGDIDDMSDSLQRIAAESEKYRRRQAKRLGKEYSTGLVPRSVRIDGHNIEAHQAMIVVQITVPIGMGIGDKLVIGNQMKSTVGEILFGDNRTLEGEAIDVIFGAKSCLDRIVLSPFNNGTTNTVLRFIGEDAYNFHFGNE